MYSANYYGLIYSTNMLNYLPSLPSYSIKCTPKQKLRLFSQPQLSIPPLIS